MYRPLIALACLSTALSLAACSTTVQEDISQKQWQITAVYDVPDLPPNAPEAQLPPTIVFGAEDYTVNSACGTAQGTLQWHNDTQSSTGNVEGITTGTISVKRSESVRAVECAAAAQTFYDRFLTVLDGDFEVHLDDNGLRFTQINGSAEKDRLQQRGWTAVLAQ